MGKNYITEEKIKIETTLGVDLTEVDVVKYLIKKGDGTLVEWTCVVDDEEAGIIYYYTIEGDFNVSGKYILHVDLVFVDGTHLISDPITFKVYDLYQV